MYEFIETEGGWLLCWGPSPRPGRPDDRIQEGPEVLPFRPRDEESEDRPAA